MMVVFKCELAKAVGLRDGYMASTECTSDSHYVAAGTQAQNHWTVRCIYIKSHLQWLIFVLVF